MPPVLSTSAERFRVASRPVPKPPASLFPLTPKQPDPERRAGEAAPLASGPGGSLAVSPAADCPPPQAEEAPRAPQSTDAPDRRGPATLVGIARLAASSPPAETRRKSAAGPEYFHLPVRSVLNHCDSERVPFEWTINPYRGCEFACRYCYARYTHEYMELDGADFERKIFVKQNAGPLLARDLLHKYRFPVRLSPSQFPEHIAIGTATDPYQPAELEFGVTRACLEELAKLEGLSLSITTKSQQIVRDLELLKRISERSSLFINLTVTTLRTRLARLLEPRAPRPDLRLAAVAQLREAGLAVGVFASPLLPGITDRDTDLDSLAAAAKDAGAQWFAAGVLFLMPSSRKQFLPFLREKFPRLEKQYDEWYARNGYAPEAYRRAIAERIVRLRAKYGFNARPWDEMPRPTPCVQLSLGWETSVEAEPRPRKQFRALG